MVYNNTCCSPPSTGQSCQGASPSVPFGSTGVSAPEGEGWPAWIADCGHYSVMNCSAYWKTEKKPDRWDVCVEAVRMEQTYRTGRGIKMHYIAHKSRTQRGEIYKTRKERYNDYMSLASHRRKLTSHLFSMSCSSSWTLWQSSSAGKKLFAAFIKSAATLLLHSRPAIRRFSPWSMQASTTATHTHTQTQSISQYLI